MDGMSTAQRADTQFAWLCTIIPMTAVNESTAIKYNERLKKFGLFVSTHYNNSSVDNIVIQIRKNKIDVRYTR
jgi:hypothetical protein